MAEKEKKEKKSWGYKDSKSGKKVSAFRDMFDGGGRGGSGASFSTMSNADYKAAGGKDRDPNVQPSGFTRQTPDGRGETLTGFRGMMANPAIGGLLGAFTGGIGGAAIGALRPALGNQIRSNGGLLQTLGLQSKLAPNTSMRPQIRPDNLALPKVALPKVASPYQSYMGPFDPRDGAGQVDWGTDAFGPLSKIGINSSSDSKMNMATEPLFQPYIPPYGSDYTNWQRNNGGMPTPKGVPYSNTNGPMGALGSKIMPNASNGMPPSGMSDQMYSSWLRNQNGAINVDNMTPEGLRYMYENYRRSPAFQ
jgi:hypothetical protein